MNPFISHFWHKKGTSDKYSLERLFFLLSPFTLSIFKNRSWMLPDRMRLREIPVLISLPASERKVYSGIFTAIVHYSFQRAQRVRKAWLMKLSISQICFCGFRSKKTPITKTNKSLKSLSAN